MAAQVLSGTGNVSYTNNTGQNARIIINYMESNSGNISMSWGGTAKGTATGPTIIGRNLAYISNYGGGTTSTFTSNNASYNSSSSGTIGGLPTELMLSPGHTFSATPIKSFNIVVIPENG